MPDKDPYADKRKAQAKRREATEKALADCQSLAEVIAAAQQLKEVDHEVLASRMDDLIGRK